MEVKRKNLCPLLKKKCIQMDCVWFVKLAGTDPQDAKKEIETWDCAVVWNLTVGLEVAKRVAAGTEGIQAAQESFRNEIVRVAENRMNEMTLLPGHG